MLDALVRVGARGVAVDIPYPLLDPGQPRNDEYLAFYEQVVHDVRARGLKLMIETQVVFTNTPYSQLDVDYSSMPLDEFLAGRTAQTVRIAHELRPDYLAFTTEQTTDAMLTHQPVSTDRYVQFVDDTIAAVGPVKGVALGAGSGNWEDPELVERLAADPAVDFVDVHVYPLATPRLDLLAAARHMVDVARRHHKEVVVGEAWLYKASAAEVAGGVNFVSVIPRDSLAYWAPLDADYIDTIARFAARHRHLVRQLLLGAVPLRLSRAGGHLRVRPPPRADGQQRRGCSGDQRARDDTGRRGVPPQRRTSEALRDTSARSCIALRRLVSRLHDPRRSGRRTTHRARRSSKRS